MPSSAITDTRPFLLPQRVGRALGDVDLQPAGIKLLHGGIARSTDRPSACRARSAASRNSSEERPLTPPTARISSCVSCLRPVIATLVIRKPTALAAALRVSLSAPRTSSTMTALDDAQHAGTDQQQHRRGDADAARHAAFQLGDQPLDLLDTRAAGRRSRRAATARVARDATPRQQPFYSDQIGASSVLATERGVLHHPLHQLVKCYARIRCKLWNK